MAGESSGSSTTGASSTPEVAPTTGSATPPTGPWRRPSWISFPGSDSRTYLRKVLLEFSIILPTLNESAGIGDQIARCLALTPRPEVIVADGGSTDGTCSRVAACGARLVGPVRRGRAHQMNVGAAASEGDVLVFLHADVKL